VKRGRSPRQGAAQRPEARPSGLGLVLTCEHASNQVPARYRHALAGAAGLLHTHRASDAGALELARRLARGTGAPLIAGRATRLLIDLNRSEDQAELWSPWSAALPAAERQRLLERLHRPFRAATRAAIDAQLHAQRHTKIDTQIHSQLGSQTNTKTNTKTSTKTSTQTSTQIDAQLEAHPSPGARRAVLHLSVHSFTPVRRGQRRDMHVAFLFDPARPLEAELARRWRRALARLEPRLRIAFNRPYRGTDDGHTTALRRRYPPSRYAGLELEINQLFPRRGGPRWQRLQAHLLASLTVALPGPPRR
jgi:predicted N-formylglutamate amidohydrolase